jgi:Ni/Co efflux regulator RcnB
MQRGVIIGLALMPVLVIWPAARSIVYVGLANDAVTGSIADSSTSTSGLLQLAKHDDEGDNDDEQPEHHHHRDNKKNLYRYQQFCGPYFKPSFVPHFRNYYTRDNYANLPPGLRKHVEKTGHLPPGLEKNYERTGHLPPGLQKRLECGEMMPADYSSYLYRVPGVAYERVGPLPPDSKLYLYGNDLILLNDHTKAIIDIMRGAY